MWYLAPWSEFLVSVLTLDGMTQVVAAIVAVVGAGVVLVKLRPERRKVAAEAAGAEVSAVQLAAQTVQALAELTAKYQELAGPVEKMDRQLSPKDGGPSLRLLMEQTQANVAEMRKTVDDQAIQFTTMRAEMLQQFAKHEHRIMRLEDVCMGAQVEVEPTP